MFHAFMLAPAPTLTHKANAKLTHGVDTSKTKSVFDFFFVQPQEKKNPIVA